LGLLEGRQQRSKVCPQLAELPCTIDGCRNRGVGLSASFKQTECVDGPKVKPSALDKGLKEIRRNESYVVSSPLQTQPQRDIGLHIATRSNR
jgi:hypothetical protein